ncbi:hypothetical protein BGZ54_006456 [Gamsiella multidivaricata]|nr:hypothetical protein BGZ54_006456 [Gamsiella multidivaricata]
MATPTQSTSINSTPASSSPRGHGVRDRIFAIPELVERVAHFLDSRTIVACARVSKTWYSIWLPILWHTIDAGRQWHDPAFLNALNRHADLIRILECSRYDDISLLFASSAATTTSGIENTPTCPKNLITLVLPKTTLANQADHVRLLRLNPQLRDLSLALHDDPPSHYPELIEAVCDLQFLRRLALDEIKSQTLETILGRRNRSLQELSFKGTQFLRHPFGSGEDFAAPAIDQGGAKVKEPKESFGIQSLHLHGVACQQELLLNLGSRFPLLSRLSLRGAAELYFDDDFAEKFARLCPQIRSIDMSLIEDTDDESIARLIRAFPGLRTFRAAETRFGNMSLCAMVEGCRDLTVLDISSTYGAQSSGIQKLLERSRGLTQLDAWKLSLNVPEMMSEAYGTRVSDTETGVDTTYEVSFQHAGTGSVSGTKTQSTTHTASAGRLLGEKYKGVWACRGLESLVVGIDYSADELTEQERLLYPPSKARQFIYDQISQLANLRYLAIGGGILGIDDDGSDEEDEGDEEDEITGNGQGSGGNIETDSDGSNSDSDAAEPFEDDHDDEDWAPSSKASVKKLQTIMANLEVNDQDNNKIWIDFSLRSGLATLAPLKELRVLSVSQGVHAIGVREIEWMCKNWPNLKSIEGLYENEAEEAVAWLKKHRPDIELENDD